MVDGHPSGTLAVGSVVHARSSCSTCLRLGRAAVALLDDTAGPSIRWDSVIERARSLGPPIELTGHVGQVDDALLLAYAALLDRLLRVNREATRYAATWEAAALLGLRATLRELDAHPGAAALHYVEAARPGNDRLRSAREAYCDALITQTRSLRDDAPIPVGLEMLVGMIGTSLRRSVEDGQATHGMLTVAARYERLIRSFAPIERPRAA